MNDYTWYFELTKPAWAPSQSLFGPVWTVLYLLIIISFGFVLYKFKKGEVSNKTALPFFLNIIFNLLFTPILFGMRNLLLATADILLVLATLIWAMASIYNYRKWVTYINIPYLLWVSFATFLQLTIDFLNRSKF